MKKDFDFIKIRDKLLKYLCKFGLSDDDRGDLVSETILKVLEKRDEFYKHDSNFIGWCYTIMRNLFINDYRKKTNLIFNSYDEEPSILIGNQPMVEASDMEVISEKLRDIIISAEPDEVNRKIFFGYMNGYQYEVLAEIFDIPTGTMKSRLFSTRQRIKRALIKEGYEL